MSARMRKPGLSKGFTMLELLVVIFIMLAMSALAVATFRHFLDTERIKLAGGAVDSSIRMARQYAMSKRTKVMVEFITPPAPSTIQTLNLNTSEWAWVSAGSGGSGYNTVWNSSSHDINYGQAYQNTGNSKIMLRYPLSAIGLNDTVQSATLILDCAWTLNVDATIGLVGSSSIWSMSTLTFSNCPGPTSLLPSIQIRSSAKHFERDVSLGLMAAMDASQPDLCIEIQGVAGGTIWSVNSGTTFTSATLKVVLDHPTGEASETAPRYVRILPYKRMLDPVTGGFTWLLDQDANALKTMELPKNIHFVLTPAKISVPQYDPADLVDKSTATTKQFLVLTPDGTCSAVAPKVPDSPVGTRDHWKTYTTTVMLLDAATEDLCILYTPPATAFTRQRYLFTGAEVDSFKTLHAPYSLW